MKRRSLIKAGFAAGAVMTLVGAGVALWRPGWHAGRLTPEGREVLAAVSRGVLGPLLPADPAALGAQLDRLQATIAGFPPALQAELAELLALLASAPGRIALTGLASPWAAASGEELQATLERLRTSGLGPRQQVYHGLRDLVNAAFFADASAWRALGYPGPRDLSAA